MCCCGKFPRVALRDICGAAYGLKGFRFRFRTRTHTCFLKKCWTWDGCVRLEAFVLALPEKLWCVEERVLEVDPVALDHDISDPLSDLSRSPNQTAKADPWQSIAPPNRHSTHGFACNGIRSDHQASGCLTCFEGEGVGP